MMALPERADRFTKYDFESKNVHGEVIMVEEITSETIGPDFKRNQKIHRAWKIQHPGLDQY
jgi:23S rRNA (guanine2445-N2)-methyltransferase / 23S rRNA (guanine2069-N7)-methyltransferase